MRFGLLKYRIRSTDRLGVVASYLKDEAKQTKLMGDCITVDGHAD